MDLIIETYSQCQTESAVLQSLHRENEMLNYIRNSLVEFCIRSHGQLGIVCFYKQKSTSVGKTIGIDSMKV